MSRSRSVSETSVGLFAFLDVLMSTMGSLILVLMVVTPKIRQEAVAKAAASVPRPRAVASPLKVQPAIEKKPTYTAPVELPREIVDLNAPLKAEIAELSQQAVEQQRLVDDKHQALGTVQTSLIKSQTELEELEKRLADILRAKRRLAASVAKVSSDGVAVESQLTGDAARLRTIKGQIANASTVYTFVAYDGVSGTTRRPILVECTREHIKFVQENVSLSSTDVSGYAPSYNPVLAGDQGAFGLLGLPFGPRRSAAICAVDRAAQWSGRLRDGTPTVGAAERFIRLRVAPGRSAARRSAYGPRSGRSLSAGRRQGDLRTGRRL